jgi:thiamine pyrophosphate-dependent acetolactate synthase large subunit-like protein
VCKGGLEAWLGKAQNSVKELSEKLMSAVVIHIMHKNLLRSKHFYSIPGGGQARYCPTRQQIQDILVFLLSLQYLTKTLLKNKCKELEWDTTY